MAPFLRKTKEPYLKQVQQMQAHHRWNPFKNKYSIIKETLAWCWMMAANVKNKLGVNIK
jgi:hypothetical protein